MNKTLIFFFILIFCVALIIRFFDLGKNPPGLYWDETAFGYDAYSILKTGRDQYGVYFPLFFESFGDWKLPGYFYLLVPSIGIFGLSEFAVRFPSFFFGAATIFVFYYIVRRQTKNNVLALFASAALVLSSWHIQFSRAGFESIPALFVFLLGAAFLLESKKSKSTIYLTVAFILFALTMYIYHSYRIFTPLFLVGFFILNLSIVRQQVRVLILPTASFILISIPLILFTLTPNGLNRASSQSTFNKDEFQKERLEFDQRSKPPFRFLSSKIYQEPLYNAQVVVKNYLDHFSLRFLFLKGDQIGRHSQVDLGQLHVFEFILIAISLWHLRKIDKSFLKVLLLWLFLSPIPAAIVQPSPHAQRSLQMVIPLAFLSGLGAYHIYLSKFKAVKFILIIWIIIVIAIFTRHLFVIYPKKFAPDWQDGYRQMVKSVDEVEENYETIYVTNINNAPYIYMLFYKKFDPLTYQQSGSPTDFGKYHFVSVDDPIYDKGRALYVSPSWQQTKGKLLSGVYDSNNNLVYKIWELGNED